MRLTFFPLSLALACFSSALGAQNIGQIDQSALPHARIRTFHPTPHDLNNGTAHKRFGIAGIDSIPNFNGQFFAAGVDSNGNPNRHWYTNTVGNPPQMGGTTTIGAPIQPLNIELDDANGNLRYVNGQPLISKATKYTAPVLASPVFASFSYSSSPVPTQFADAVARAEFIQKAKPDWHTVLSPWTLPATTLHMTQSADCPAGPNDAGCNYLFALNGDGTCCAFILVNTQSDFLSSLGNVIGNDISSNAITTKNISTILAPDVYLFSGDLTQCCVLGFHSFFFDSGVSPEPVWVFAFASWVSSSIFGPQVGDVTTLSHEITEISNDPFVVGDGVHDLTPWWLAPNGLCQNNLETGDVLEGIPNFTLPMAGPTGFIYHPQNEALMQWFEFMDPSNAIDGAYSYPDTNLLESPSTPQTVGCQ